MIEFAFRQASLRGLPLMVMHCFFDVVLAARDSAALDPALEPAEVDDLRLLLAESVAGMREKFPDVEVDLRLAQGLVDQCLVDNAPQAELLIVGHSDPRGWSRFLNASCALAVLERATTTVVVVPEHPPESRAPCSHR